VLQKPDVALANALKMLRKHRGLSQEAIAFAADISTSSVSRIERALMNPPWTLVRQMADVLGVSIAELAAAVEREDSAR
jgi:transcriptional regulator with XRE-family HTH domain